MKDTRQQIEQITVELGYNVVEGTGHFVSL
jgi:hypothetical protein